MDTLITDFYSNSSVDNCPKENKPEYAFIGRSNVGKSSLINMIVNKKIAYTSSKPGKTQLINHIAINNEWALVDLPGYGYAKLAKKKRLEILTMTKKYLTHRGVQLVGVFMLIDIRIKAQKIDLEWMKWMVQNNIYFIRIFTKCDSMNKNKILKQIENHDQTMKENHWAKIPETIITSSKNKTGKKEILAKINELNLFFQNI
ncbi:MAG: YihA family ribosome biogenesis GTP-binding protein [Flavobacteriales bacterium]|nr:YihA family ribosome biogenesis GTP-binding protein [Flavobacteriales bacterium]|tara:strand:- start:242 stop:847 length:606 start_codon:yes stop_codon:yes gene_type:complete